MSTPARFSDGQYKNWLNCNISFTIMKEALHEYMNNEVIKLHGDIKQKVSSILSDSSIDNQCGSCSSKDIKRSGGKHGTWSINCKNSICDKWLQEILAVHDDPHNPSINWNNADISKWPTDCYQVAKIFMPKGRDKAIKMPDDLNLPEILSLMKDCSWFRIDLPNKEILSDLIEIRNIHVHASDMRVADSDKDSWIDLMIQLLSDLKISGDAQAELQKRKNSPVEEEQRVTAVEEQGTAVEEQMENGEQRSLQRGLPPEILRMDENAQQLYREALEDGKEKVFNIRLMIVGHLGVGKTTITRCILGEKVEEAPHVPTEGIEVHHRCCKIDLDDDMKKWFVEQKELVYPDSDQSLVNIVFKYVEKDKNSKDDVNQEEKNRIQQPPTKVIKTDKEMSKPQNVQSDPNETTNIRVINDTKKSDLHEFVAKCGTMTPSKKTFCYVTMLDFAGEFVFYTTRQMFMSWRTLYLLVTDISKFLTDLVEGDKCSMKRSIQDYVIYWFNSIYSHGMPSTSLHYEGRTQRETENDEKNRTGAAKYPPVILVATHSDKLPDKLSEGEKSKIKDEYFDGLRRILKDRPQRFLLNGTFAINNFGPPADIDALKQKIFELAEQQDYWGEEMPGTWLALEQKLMELKRSGKKIIEYSHMEKINASSDVQIKKPEELEVFLRFEHDLGNIVFFNTEQLRANVVLDPVWLMDGVKNLIKPIPSMIKVHQEIHPQYYKFKDTGQLTESLVGDGHEDFDKNREYLLDLMEKLSIIVKSVKKDNDVQDQEPYYWVPCVICKPAPADVKNRDPCENITKTSTLCFVSKMKFIHVGVFHRLVASFLSMWLPVKDEIEDKYCLYSDCCEFQVDPRHSILLTMNDYVIFATMFRYSSRKEDPDNGLCSKVRNHISSMLDDINLCICPNPNSEFEIWVKCDQSSTDTINGLLPISGGEMTCRCSKNPHPVDVENLMKFWKKKDNCQQKQDQDDTTHHDSPGRIASVSPMPTPPTGDTDRFMRITYLLVDIGARVLRRLLSHHTVTSTCTLDQYLAKMKNTFNKHKGVFNKSLMEIMFPPNGNDTNLDDYDITLLSALFNNVMPSLSQQEKDMIQNLRENRNKLFAHAKSCQINASDFEIHWNDISSTLITLSQQCGDAAFEVKMSQEINLAKISATPAGSYLDILKAWFDMIETFTDVIQKNVKEEVQKAVKDELLNVTSRLQALESKDQSSAV